MIKSFKSSKAEWILIKIIQYDKFWDLNPVIAGGAALSAYKAIKLYNSEYRWDAFKRERGGDARGCEETIQG